MKGLLFARVNFSRPENSGIYLKCQGQLKVLRSNYQTVDFLYFRSDGLYLNDQLVHKVSSKSMNNKAMLAKLFMVDLGKIISKKINLEGYSFLLFRYSLSSKGILRLLQNFDKINPTAKIVTEFPTYPYTQEYLGIARKIELRIDQFYRKKVFALIDKIAHLGKETNIYDTPTLSFGNGITVDDFPVASTKTNWEQLQIITVGNFNYWHGLDRLLHGIHQYKNGKKIKVRIIGRGWESIQQLSESLGLSDQIDFYSPLTPTELNKHYAWANFGIGTLGIHRKGVEVNQSLKHREYAARGLNFIYAGQDPGFSKSCEGIINIDETEVPLDIKILFENLEDHTLAIKSHAKQYISWKTQFKNIVDFLKEKNF